METTKIELCKRANKITNAILLMFKTRSIKVHMSAFDGYVRPIVEYHQYVWSPTLYCDTDLVKNVKRSFM